MADESGCGQSRNGTDGAGRRPSGIDTGFRTTDEEHARDIGADGDVPLTVKQSQKRPRLINLLPENAATKCNYLKYS